MKFNHIYRHLFLLILASYLIIHSGCKKDFLDKKPDMSFIIPKTLPEFEGLLNNYAVINNTPNFDILCSDEYEFLTLEIWQATNEIVRNSYNWNHTFYQTSTDWVNAYKIIMYANTVITGLEKIEKTPANTIKYGDIKGQAYFLRAHTFFQLAQVFALPYDRSSATTDLGIPLQLEVNPNKPQPRATIAETYHQIIQDLEEAANNFSDNFPLKTTLGSKAAALALLARTHLVMFDYPKAELAAKASLALRGNLLDYNTLVTTSTQAFDVVNPELLFNTTHGDASINFDFYAINYGAYGYTFKTRVNPQLISLYSTNDLRLKLFFFQRDVSSPDLYIKNLYQVSTFSFAPFSGLATDEVHLILAECYARGQKKDEAVAILQKMADHRYPTGSVPTIVATDADEALKLVLLERRKQLVYRGSRWLDVRRLNKTGAAITMSRNVSGTVYSIAPNDKRFALPIPQDEISFSSIKQN